MEVVELSPLQILALVWTFSSSIGAARAGQKLLGSRADRAYLKANQVNGPMKIMAHAWVLADTFRLAAFFMFWFLGIIATITDGMTGKWMIRIAIFLALFLLIAHGEIMSKARRDIMRQHPGSPTNRRKTKRR
jgi:CBS domain containing-hemolysin-like protein